MILEPVCATDAEAFVTVAAHILDLPLDPAHRPGVIANMQILLAHARMVNGFPLAFDTVGAPEFVA